MLRRIEDVYLSGPGKTAQFTCDVDGTPKPEILWFKNGNEIASSEKFVKVGEYLFILNAGQEDSGNYKCIARNQLGEEVTQKASLVVGRSIYMCFRVACCLIKGHFVAF